MRLRSLFEDMTFQRRDGRDIRADVQVLLYDATP